MSEAPEDNIEAFDVTQLGSSAFGLTNQRPQRKLEGWHRPRKQYVRNKLIVGTLSDVLANRDPADQVNYLGLPGADLLDLIYLRKHLCEPTNRTLRFLGFDTSAESKYVNTVSENVAIQQLKQSALVSESSKVRSDDIRSAASATSKAYREVEKFAPYDVVNLDLCDGFLKDEAGVDQSFYSLVTRLLGLQRGNPHPWILLITTVIDETAVTKTAADKIEAVFKKYLAHCPEVAELCLALFESAPGGVALGSSSPTDLLNLIRVGLSQWLLDLANPFAKVKLVGSFGYRLRSEAECDDIVTLAFRFTPLNAPLSDHAGLAPAAAEVISDPCNASAQVVRRVSNSIDVDEKLQNDQDARLEAVDQCTDLLIEARYEAAEIKEWLQAEGFGDVVAVLDVFDGDLSSA